MLDISVLQATTKTDSSAKSKNPERMSKSGHEESDFDHAYSASAEEGNNDEVRHDHAARESDPEKPDSPLNESSSSQPQELEELAQSDDEPDFRVEDSEFYAEDTELETLPSDIDDKKKVKRQPGPLELAIGQSLEHTKRPSEAASQKESLISEPRQPQPSATAPTSQPIMSLRPTPSEVVSNGQKTPTPAILTQNGGQMAEITAATASLQPDGAETVHPNDVELSILAGKATNANRTQTRQTIPTNESFSPKIVLTPDRPNSRTERSEVATPPISAPPTITAVSTQTTAQVFQQTIGQQQLALAPTAFKVELGDSDTSSIGALDPETPTVWETRAATTSSLVQTLSRPETPGLIGRQMAEVLQRMPDRPVELSLNPEELGRVRMSISAAENGITVSVLAERPETLDLMRRHIDQLAREFQALGYESINFAFSERSGEETKGESSAKNSQPAQSGELAALPQETSEQHIELVGSNGVDLRM